MTHVYNIALDKLWKTMGLASFLLTRHCVYGSGICISTPVNPSYYILFYYLKPFKLLRFVLLVRWFMSEILDLWALSRHDGQPGSLKSVNLPKSILPGGCQLNRRHIRSKSGQRSFGAFLYTSLWMNYWINVHFREMRGSFGKGSK